MGSTEGSIEGRRKERPEEVYKRMLETKMKTNEVEKLESHIYIYVYLIVMYMSSNIANLLCFRFEGLSYDCYTMCHAWGLAMEDSLAERSQAPDASSG